MPRKTQSALPEGWSYTVASMRPRPDAAENILRIDGLLRYRRGLQ